MPWLEPKPLERKCGEALVPVIKHGWEPLEWSTGIFNSNFCNKETKQWRCVNRDTTVTERNARSTDFTLGGGKHLMPVCPLKNKKASWGAIAYVFRPPPSDRAGPGSEKTKPSITVCNGGLLGFRWGWICSNSSGNSKNCGLTRTNWIPYTLGCMEKSARDLSRTSVESKERKERQGEPIPRPWQERAPGSERQVRKQLGGKALASRWIS